MKNLPTIMDINIEILNHFSPNTQAIILTLLWLLCVLIVAIPLSIFTYIFAHQRDHYKVADEKFKNKEYN